MQVGFQMKISQETSNSMCYQKQNNMEICSYVKVGCAFPLKQCPFYLLYQIGKDRTVLFGYFLSHSHEMGPISAKNN